MYTIDKPTTEKLELSYCHIMVIICCLAPIMLPVMTQLASWQLSVFSLQQSEAMLEHAKGPFYQYGLTLILAWISNNIPCNVWDEITCPFPYFNDATFEVWE